jgi:PucR family transcriptional regulator, purine catabolism regulatory protein
VAVDADPLRGFTLGELLDGDLGLELVTGGEHARDRRVAGAHSIEIDHAAAWLGRDWVMLTTGGRLRHSADAQRRLVSELDEIGAAALGFGVGMGFKSVPSALLREARTRDLPVFSVPLRTPFRDVVSAVNGSLLSSEVRAMQRLSSLQLYLMDALEEDDPRAAIIDRLAEFVAATVTLFAADGSVIAASGPAPGEAIWREITARPAALVQFEHDGRETVAIPLGREANEVSWLAVSSSRTQPIARVARAAARATAPMLAALARLQNMAEVQERAIRGAVLNALLGDGDEPDHGSLAARAASLGIDGSTPASVVLVSPGPRPDPSAEPALRAILEAALGDRGLSFLTSTRKNGCVLLVQASPADIQAAIGEALAGHPDAVAGVGRPVAALGDIPESLRDAEIALERTGADPGRRMLAFQDFDLATLVATEVATGRLTPMVEDLIGTLHANEGFFDTVVAYFEHDLDVRRTAEALHLHHNSVRYRLARVEDRLGRSLKDPATIASIYIALAAHGHG